MDEHSIVTEWTTSATFFGPENCPIAMWEEVGGGWGEVRGEKWEGGDLKRYMYNDMGMHFQDT